MSKDESFGIIPILQQDNTSRFLLIQHQAGHWGFPKGHADPGESALEAACREFEEETGITDYTPLEGITFSEQYTFTRQEQTYEKTVTYFLASVYSETVTFQQEEVQNYAWVAYEPALELITYNASKQTLKNVQKYLTSNPLSS